MQYHQIQHLGIIVFDLVISSVGSTVAPRVTICFHHPVVSAPTTPANKRSAGSAEWLGQGVFADTALIQAGTLGGVATNGSYDYSVVYGILGINKILLHMNKQ